VIAAHGHQEVAAESDMVGDGLGNLLRVDEIGRLAFLAIRTINEGDVVTGIKVLGSSPKA